MSDDAMRQYYIDCLVESGWLKDMSLLDELGFQQIDPDAQGIVDLDLLDLSVDIEVTTLDSQLGIGMEDIQPVEDNSDAVVPDVMPKQQGQDHGIEASDVGSLLEQFEEKASKDLGESKVQPSSTEKEANNNSDLKDKNVLSDVEAKFLTKEFLERIQRLRAEKKKKTVMLPVCVPAKRGRGRAMTRGHPVALPISCTPLRLQRVMMQNQELRDNIPLADDSVNVVNKYNDTLNKATPCDNKNLNSQQVFSDHDYFKKGDDSSGAIAQGHDLEDGEVIEDEVSVDVKPDKSKHEKRVRRRGESPDIPDNDDSQYFDKLPSYYTALSIPYKQFKKTAAHVTRRGGLSVHDYIARDNSPVRETTDSTCNKIPNYYCSFTNSTKYDTLNIDSCSSKTNEDSNSVKDSGYSSLCHSVQDSDSSSVRSRSRSPNVSHSPSGHFHRRSRKGNYRRQSSCSPSSIGSSSRSCSRSSCSGCESSRSRSRNLSVSSSRSRSSSCSTCASRSSSVCSDSSCTSEGRSWKRERQLRAERTSRHRSGERARRNRSRSSAYSCSRSRSRDFRSRSRSCTPPLDKERQRSRERRREVKKQEREEEKEKQMRERRIVYVGGIPSNFTRHKLRGAFTKFGEIEHVQLHFREHGDNYGFVTFMYTCDAYAAIEKGKHLPELKAFDLCFGGRRQFCDVEYADLDGNKEVEEEFDPKPRKQEILDFDELLRQAKAKIKK